MSSFNLPGRSLFLRAEPEKGEVSGRDDDRAAPRRGPEPPDGNRQGERPDRGRAAGPAVARALASCCDTVLVASGDGQRLDWLGLPQVADAIPDAGPLGGLVAGLEAAREGPVAVVAVDMPYASAALFLLLTDRWSSEDAVVPVSAEGSEPLHAVYAAAAGPAFRELLDEGVRSMREALTQVRTLEVPETDWRAADPTGRFAFNVNAPEDLPV